jgi:hypothetical protein
LLTELNELMEKKEKELELLSVLNSILIELQGLSQKINCIESKYDRCRKCNYPYIFYGDYGKITYPIITCGTGTTTSTSTTKYNYSDLYTPKIIKSGETRHD